MMEMKINNRFNQLIIYVTLIVAGSVAQGKKHWEHEATLRTTLLGDDDNPKYNFKVRPDSNVPVGVRLSLLAINQLDVPMQLLSISGWLTVTWEDSRLVWNATDYGGITDIYDTEEYLWRPQLIVDNAVNNLGILEDEKLVFRAASTGKMTWEPPGIFETYCDVDVTYYPFDTQECKVEVTSWAYTLKEVNLQATDDVVYLADYSENGEWDITGTHTTRRVLSDGEDRHSQIDFVIQLRRKPAYYANTILIPVIVTSLLCVLVFWLPADSGEKVGYSLTILLTYTVMLTLVSDLMPPTSKTTSVLSVYLTIILFMGVISCLMTVCVLVCHHHDTEAPIPNWLAHLSREYLIKIAGWKPSKFTSDHNDVSTSFSNGSGDTNAKNSDSINVTLREGDTEIHLMEKPEPKVWDLQWTEVAVILDRVCFKILGVFVVLLTLIVMLILTVGAYTK